MFNYTKLKRLQKNYGDNMEKENLIDSIFDAYVGDRTMPPFIPMQKIGRLTRGCTVTEKIDGTNASIFIDENLKFFTGSRSRWITPNDDNYGFSKWAHLHKDELMQLGIGLHFGEWWGRGIQRNYGLQEKRFSLFNTNRWGDDHVRPACCSVVPILFNGTFTSEAIELALQELRINGSKAVPGWMTPEGLVVYHHATKQLFKKTLDKDEQPKSLEIKEGIENNG